VLVTPVEFVFLMLALGVGLGVVIGVTR